jgi:hypothetical protein
MKVASQLAFIFVLRFPPAYPIWVFRWVQVYSPELDKHCRPTSGPRTNPTRSINRISRSTASTNTRIGRWTLPDRQSTSCSRRDAIRQPQNVFCKAFQSAPRSSFRHATERKCPRRDGQVTGTYTQAGAVYYLSVSLPSLASWPTFLNDRSEASSFFWTS